MSSDHVCACRLLTFGLRCIIEAIYHCLINHPIWDISTHFLLTWICAASLRFRSPTNAQYNTNSGCCAWVKPTLSHISTVKSINFWLLNDLEPRWCRHPSPRPHLRIDWVHFLDMVHNPQICCEEWWYSVFLLLQIKMPSGSCTCA